GNSIFYLDSSNQAVVRTGFDGNTQDLSFTNPTKQVYTHYVWPLAAAATLPSLAAARPQARRPPKGNSRQWFRSATA
ncbi:MAG TPA: hypothetical protein VFP68_20395, partial [Burkholderiaceae bacterium]|nr:hypothetical protein [Burkholderiaceae bacterium]